MVAELQLLGLAISMCWGVRRFISDEVAYQRRCRRCGRAGRIAYPDHYHGYIYGWDHHCINERCVSPDDPTVELTPETLRELAEIDLQHRQRP